MLLAYYGGHLNNKRRMGYNTRMRIFRRIITTILFLASACSLGLIIANFKHIVNKFVPILTDKAGCKAGQTDSILGGSANCQGMTQATQIGLLISILVLIFITLQLFEAARQSWIKKPSL
jgi:hypothetical protein